MVSVFLHLLIKGNEVSILNHQTKITHHAVSVNDAKFHSKHPDLFALASEDTMVSLWDLRKPTQSPLFLLGAHKDEVFSLDWNPFNEFIFLTSAADGLISLWDIRNLGNAIHSFEGHQDKCTKVEWSPHFEHLFVSSGDDSELITWDCSKIGDDAIEGDGADGPQELIFKHSGHRGKVFT
jgi:histone-binding protein RBBP4